MSENCSHNCKTCGSDCSSRDKHQSLNEKSSVKKVIGVISGKGGVGKSMVTSLMALSAARKGLKTGILDADITGPSIPKTFGIKNKAQSDGNYLYPAKSAVNNIDIMSTNLLLENDTDPVIWRGPVIAGVVNQFWSDTVWEDIDVMFVDMPPGTGDVALTVFQSLPVDGIIIVTSPQELVSMIVEKAVKMAGKMDVPILGIVENMSYFKCPDCDKIHNIFGESHIDELAKQYGIKNVAKLPIDMSLVRTVDKGEIENFDGEAIDIITNAFGGII